MADTNWLKVKGIFTDALRHRPEDRGQFLDGACGEDRLLRREVESLLSSYAGAAEGFLESPAVEEMADSFVARDSLEEGLTFGHYEIIERIGTGGMGDVYLAQDKKLDRKVGVKILKEKFSSHGSNPERFVQEAKAASSLNHPNILIIHEIGEAGESQYIVSEYVDGKTLREIFEEKALELKEVLDISIQSASALVAAHEAHLIHRDIKPENIMIHRRGLVKILDFGLAKLLEQNAFAGLAEEVNKQNQTTKGVIMGTVNYMSPEQAKGEKVDERTDIFSLGAVIYEMIAGKTPFAGDSMPVTFANLINQETEPLSHFAANVPEELQKIVTRMLAKNKEERYQNIKEVLLDLENLKENLTFEEKLLRFASHSDAQATFSLQEVTGAANKRIAETKNDFTQKFKRHKLLFVFSLMIFLIGGLGFGYFYLFPKKNAPVTNGKKTIAVLPFVNATRDADAEYLSDGITENIINNLSRLSGLKVRAKNSVFRYKEKQIDPRKVADELGVEALLIGDIKQLSGKIVINVSLIDPTDGSQIWGKQFVKNSSDVIATQNEIAQSVAQNLRITLTDVEKQILSKRPTENAEAWELYLRGQLLGQQVTPEGMSKSIELNLKAIEKDPSFALAYSDIGMRYMNLGIYFEPPQEMMPKAKDFANRALEIDSTLSEPHVVLGTIALLYDWNWDKAKEELTEGNLVNLQSIEAFNCTAHVLQVTGRTSEADESLRRALENDPLSKSLTTELECNFYFAGRYDESISKYREALAIEPRNFMALYGLARTLNHKRQYREAIDELQKAKSFMTLLPPIALAEIGYAFAKMGDREEAEKHLKILDEASKQHFVDPYFMATVYLGLDDKDQALAWLEKSYEARSTFMPSIIGDVKWNDLRRDARFQSLLTRMGIESKTD